MIPTPGTQSDSSRVLLAPLLDSGLEVGSHPQKELALVLGQHPLRAGKRDATLRRRLKEC